MVTNGFGGYEYLQYVARRLVLNFSEASAAGHPGLIGSARETPARTQLEKILPGNFGVGSGIVIDSFGGKSKHQDIVIFEKNLCPVFTINDTPEATYYPVEGVMAVGEVKSTLDKEKLFDAFEKIKSVKCLKRIVEAEADPPGFEPTVPFRLYGSMIGISGVSTEQYSMENPFDQVFGFLLAGSSSLRPETLLDHAANFAQDIGQKFTPNFIVSLEDGYMSWSDSLKRVMYRSAMRADTLAFYADSKEGFPLLIQHLGSMVSQGELLH